METKLLNLFCELKPGPGLKADNCSCVASLGGKRGPVQTEGQ